MRSPVVLCLVIAAIAGPMTATADTRLVSTTIDRPIGSVLADEFGNAMAADDSHAIVCSEGQGSSFYLTGDHLCYIYRLDGWVLEEVLNTFAGDITVDGPRAILGARLWIEDSDKWSPELDLHELVTTYRGAFDLAGDRMLIESEDLEYFQYLDGAWTARDLSATGSTSVWYSQLSEGRLLIADWQGFRVFLDDGSSLTLEQTIVADDPWGAPNSTWFGQPFATDGANLAIHGISQGIDTLYLFEYDGNQWLQTGILRDPGLNDLGDYKIRLDDGALTVVAREIGCCNIALRFEKDLSGEWTEEWRIALANIADHDIVLGPTAILGAKPSSSADYPGGSVEVYDAADGSYLRRLEPDPAISGLWYGSRGITATQNRIVIQGDTSSTERGNSIFDLDGTSWQFSGEIESVQAFSITGTSLWGQRIAQSEATDQFGGIVGLTQIGVFDESQWTVENEIDIYLGVVDFFGDSITYWRSEDTEDGFDSYIGTALTADDTWDLADLFYTTGNEFDIATEGGRMVIREDTQLHTYELEGGVPVSISTMAWPFPNDGDAQISISGDRLLISNPTAFAPWHWSGAAWIYRFEDGLWVFEDELTPTTLAPDDKFGSSVSLVGDTAVVGAPYDDENGTNSGAVYVFNRAGSQWNLTAELLADVQSQGDREDEFGINVHAWGRRIAISAPYADGFSADRGTTYLVDDRNLFPHVLNVKVGGANDERFAGVVGTDDGSVLAGSISSWGGQGLNAYVARFDHHGTRTHSRWLGAASDDLFTDISARPDGGFYAVGRQSSWGSGGSETWIVKLNENLNTGWNKILGGAGDEGWNAVASTTDGGAITAGFVESWGGVGRNGLLRKYSPTGVGEWGAWVGATGTDELFDVIETSDGSIIAVGTQDSWGPGGDNGWVVKLSATGTKQWSRAIGSSADEGLVSIQETTDGGFIAVGWSTKNGGSTQGWIVGLDSSGQQIWEAVHGEPGVDDRFTDFFIEGDHVIFAVGQSDGPLGNGDGWLAAMRRTDGTMHWQRHAGGGQADAFEAIARSGLTGYLMAGWQSSWGAGGAEAWLKSSDWDGSW